MSEKFNPENKTEQFPMLKLEIIPPTGDKNFMIRFTCQNKKECQAYNQAIHRVLKSSGFEPFHQLGTAPDEEHTPGLHAWEIWKDSDLLYNKNANQEEWRKKAQQDLMNSLPAIYFTARMLFESLP